MSKTIISILIATACLLTSCIKEDLSNCPTDYAQDIYFIYDGNGNTDIFDSKIESVDLYVFDRQGKYVNNYRYSQTQLEAYQGAKLRLSQGNYTVVAWGNVTGLSEITDESDDISDYRLFSAPFLHKAEITDFDSLYYGKQNLIIPKADFPVDTIYFRSSHIKMEVYVQGLETTIDTRAVNDPNGWLEVRNVYVGYDFDMNVTGDKTNMFPDLLYDSTGDWALSRFNLLRFDDDNDILIDIYNGAGEKVYTVVLQDFLSENNINVENINEITVPIRVIFAGPTNVHVSVAEWNNEIVRPIF